MTEAKSKPTPVEIKDLIGMDRDFLRPLVEAFVQEVLEAEMLEAVGAAKGERTETRLGYRSGYYGRTLITRVGKLELRVPQDRQGRFSTDLFDRYQRSAAMASRRCFHFGSSSVAAWRRLRSSPSSPRKRIWLP